MTSLATAQTSAERSSVERGSSLAKLYADTLITCHARMELVVEVIGRTMREADKARGLDPDATQTPTEPQILSELAAHPEELARVGASLRVQAALKLFEMQSAVHDELVTALGELEGKDVAHLYSSLTHEIMAATAGSQYQAYSQPDPEAMQAQFNQDVLDSMPADLRKVLVERARVLNSLKVASSESSNGN